MIQGKSFVMVLIGLNGIYGCLATNRPNVFITDSDH